MCMNLGVSCFNLMEILDWPKGISYPVVSWSYFVQSSVDLCGELASIDDASIKLDGNLFICWNQIQDI